MSTWVENYPRRPHSGQAFERRVLWPGVLKQGRWQRPPPVLLMKPHHTLSSPEAWQQILKLSQRKGHLGSATA